MLPFAEFQSWQCWPELEVEMVPTYLTPGPWHVVDSISCPLLWPRSTTRNEKFCLSFSTFQKNPSTWYQEKSQHGPPATCCVFLVSSRIECSLYLTWINWNSWCSLKKEAIKNLGLSFLKSGKFLLEILQQSILYLCNHATGQFYNGTLSQKSRYFYGFSNVIWGGEGADTTRCLEQNFRRQLMSCKVWAVMLTLA